MSMHINVPDDLYREAARIAQSRNVSVDDVFVSAFTEHVRACASSRERPAETVTTSSQCSIRSPT